MSVNKFYEFEKGDSVSVVSSIKTTNGSVKSVNEDVMPIENTLKAQQQQGVEAQRDLKIAGLQQQVKKLIIIFCCCLLLLYFISFFVFFSLYLSV